MPRGQQTAGAPTFGPGGGIGAGFFLPRAGPSSAPPPCSASSTPAPLVPQTVPPRFPQLQEYSRRHPFLKPVMGRGMGTQIRGISGAPLTARAQDVEDGIGTRSSGDPRAPAPKPMRIFVLRHSRLEHGPEGVRDSIAGRHFIHRCPQAGAFLSFCCGHGTSGTINQLFG
jgi:hypothetical protein